MSDDFIFRGALADVDPDVTEIIRRETARQRETIILIASESETPDAIHEAANSPFAHIYAEGYPREASRRQTQAEIMDLDYELARYRRYSDPRYYKGVEYADAIEALCRRRAAELFAANGVAPDSMYVNVQALSGGPANSAVYTALLDPGDTILSLKLSDGGHLSHGAPVNRSGIIYDSQHYVVDQKTEQLDYDAIETQALTVRPKIIVAGYSAYPLIIDWRRFRAIADKVGAYLLADIAHISGLVAAGVHPSPIGIADVVSTTTHKSLCGPRGAMIMTHKASIARKIDRAVFPGEQGGPHVNTITGLAVALKLANTDRFRALQQRIVDNAARLAQQLQARGLRVVAGKSENHLLLVDTKSVRVDGAPLSGDMAARILDIAGIVVNRNNIPGDKSALNPFGIRLGTVWISQRGFGPAEVDRLAEAIATLLHGCTPFKLTGSGTTQYRARVAPAALAKARAIVGELTGHPAHPVTPGATALRLHGRSTGAFLDAVLSNNVLELAPGAAERARLSGPDFDIALTVARDDDAYRLHFDTAAETEQAAQWLRDLSDGYVQVGDLHAKVPGPVAIAASNAAAPAVDGDPVVVATKPFTVGAAESAGEPLPAFVWTAPDDAPIQETPLAQLHATLGAKLIPFAGWNMPVWYSSVTDEHNAVRRGAGVFDVAHMGVFEASGPHAAAFLDQVTTNDVAGLGVGRSHYTYLLAPDGRVIDDLLIYRLETDRYMLVVNAANAAEDWAWLTAVNAGAVRIDDERPWVQIQYSADLRDLRAPSSGDDRRVDIALQGPQSERILLALGTDVAAAARIKALGWSELTTATVGGFDLIVSRTGYTGERQAFELFVHPEAATALFRALVDAGATPCGLAARDSTRTEAGLPLHGHELAGPYALDPFEARFGKFVQTWKPWFIGRAAMVAAEGAVERKVVRFRMAERGVRRPELGDPVLDGRGKVIGVVTSCAIDSEGYLLGQAVVPNDAAKKGTTLAIYALGGGTRSLRVPTQIKLGSRMPQPDAATVLTRFPRRR